MKTSPNTFTATYEDFIFDVKSIHSFLEVAKPKHLLDLGAGFGRTMPLYDGIEKITLVDRSEEMCLRLREKFAGQAERFKVVHAPSFCLPFEDSSFYAIIIALAALAEMEPQIFTLGEVARVLKPGGHLYTLTINPDSFKNGCSGSDNAVNSHWPEAVGTTATIPALQAMMNQLGLVLKQVGGDFSNNEYGTESPLVVITATKSDSLSKSVTSIENAQVCEAIYDGMACKYDSIAGSNTYQVPGWLKNKLLPYKDMNPVILDCACATGNLCRVLDSVGLTPSYLFGVDVSSEMVRAARALKRYTAVIQADLTGGLAFHRDNLFDFCIANGCLEFIARQTQFFKSLFRATNPGGQILCTFEQAAAEDETDRVIEMNVGSKILRRYPRSQATVKKILKESGWSLESIESNSGYVSPMTGQKVEYWYCSARKNP